MDIIYKSVFDGVNDDITRILDKYGVKYDRENIFNNEMQLHETKLTIHCKNTQTKTAVNHLIIALNQLAF